MIDIKNDQAFRAAYRALSVLTKADRRVCDPVKLERSIQKTKLAIRAYSHRGTDYERQIIPNICTDGCVSTERSIAVVRDLDDARRFVDDVNTRKKALFCNRDILASETYMTDNAGKQHRVMLGSVGSGVGTLFITCEETSDGTGSSDYFNAKYHSTDEKAARADYHRRLLEFYERQGGLRYV